MVNGLNILIFLKVESNVNLRRDREKLLTKYFNFSICWLKLSKRFKKFIHVAILYQSDLDWRFGVFLDDYKYFDSTFSVSVWCYLLKWTAVFSMVLHNNAIGNIITSRECKFITAIKITSNSIKTHLSTMVILHF